MNANDALEPQTILVSREGPVLTVTLNRPDRMNAMTLLMAREVYSVLEEVSRDREIRIVVLTGTGDRYFCPGADAQAVLSDEHDHERSADPDEDVIPYSIPVLLHTMPQITIAAVNGSAAGAGLGWACACDFRWSSDTAKLATAFIDRAVAGDMCLHWTLPRLVGPSKARYLMLTSPKMNAREALEIGLVDEVFPTGVFREEVASRVAKLAMAAPMALRTVKSNLVAAETIDITQFWHLETARHFDLLASEDCREGFAAFAEKRSPEFKGR